MPVTIKKEKNMRRGGFMDFMKRLFINKTREFYNHAYTWHTELPWHKKLGFVMFLVFLQQTMLDFRLCGYFCVEDIRVSCLLYNAFSGVLALNILKPILCVHFSVMCCVLAGFTVPTSVVSTTCYLYFFIWLKIHTNAENTYRRC